MATTTWGSRSKWTGINGRDTSLRICMFSIGSTGCFRPLETQREKDCSSLIYGWDLYPYTGSTSCFFILPLIPVHLLRERHNGPCACIVAGAASEGEAALSSVRTRESLS
jgi:hypothetical protein